ncbi:MAG TPA: efflux RND transporter periplasmic adaptor subunit [Candidatus Limnocylindrales bacterium]|nr:efflux RND transporter periplasmic adaptor subunit [Candidatus Limnocylindrales bacterium]
MKNKKKLIILFSILIIAVLLIYEYIQGRSGKEPNILRVSGNIEITDAEISFKIAGRVEERLVSEGERVQAGQVVARLDHTELVHQVALRKAEVEVARAALAELEAGPRPEEIAQAEAVVRKAQAQLDELLAGSRPQDIAVAEAAVQRAKVEVNRLKADYERRYKLYQEGILSTNEYEAAQTAYKVATAQLKEAEERLKLLKEGPRKEQIEQARAALMQAKETLTLVKKGPRKETIDQARARLDQANQALAMAETQLDYATLVSPISGVVLSKNVEPGEYVAPGTPVVTLGNLDNVWLRAYINETDLGRVKVGQRVQVTTDTYPGKVYEGHISFIASQAEFTPKNVQTEKERVKLVYRIKIHIPNPNMELKPGMPADADILISSTDREEVLK